MKRSSLFRWMIGLTLLAGLALAGGGLWIKVKAVLAQILLERAFAQTVTTGQVVKPWPWADTWPVARLEVPRLRTSVVVLAGSSGQALAFGPGHVEATAEPGERGVAVFAAHRDTHFAFLKDVQIGDEIDVVRRDGRRFRYRADGARIVRFDDTDIDPQADGHALVLSTCWPFEALSHGPLRYVLHASLIARQ